MRRLLEEEDADPVPVIPIKQPGLARIYRVALGAIIAILLMAGAYFLLTTSKTNLPETKEAQQINEQKGNEKASVTGQGKKTQDSASGGMESLSNSAQVIIFKCGL